MAISKNFITIEDHRKFGELIKNWVVKPSSRPGTMQDFEKQLNKEGISYNIPAGGALPKVTKINFVDCVEDALVFALPSERMLEVGLDETTSAGGEYAIPQDYNPAYADPTKRTNLSKNERKRIFFARIGDYSIGQCF